MKNYLQKQAARIRAICILFALLPFFSQRAAAWSELLVKGAVGGDSWSTIATLTKQDANGNSYSGTIDASSWTSGAQLSFKLNDSKDNGGNLWWGNGGTADMTSNSTATLSNVNSGGNMTLKHSTSYSSYNINCTYSNDSWTIKITGVKSSTGGGGSSTTTCAPGLYIYGEKYGKTGDQYIYKLQRSSDKQYYISLNAINGAEWSGVQSYQTGQGMNNYTISTIGQTFHLVYVDANGKETAYYPSTSGYGLSGTDPNVGSSQTKLFSTTSSNNWTIGTLNTSDVNGGIYNFYVNTDVNGVPQNWYYERDETRIVAYEVNSSTNTTDAYLYGRRANTTSAYNKNFFGMVSFVKDGYLTYLFGGKTYGRRPNSTDTHTMDVAADSPNAMQFDRDGHDTGIYSTEFNPTRDYIITGDKKPTRIFIIGSALNSNLNNTFTDWDPSNATEMVYDVDEGCYKATVTLNKDKQFRFLLDHNQSGVATSLDNNFGEDSNKPGSGDDTDYNNKVQVESSSSTGENIVFNPETDTYIVRFYVERKADKQGFEWTNDYGIYRYTIEKPERLSTTITPTTATVAYAASLTPKVTVVGTTATTRTYAYTTDGTAPTIDTTTGRAKGTTKVVTYTYDKVIPSNDLGTFYMAPGNVLTFIDNEGNTSTLTGNKVTVKAQAVQTVTAGSKYRLEGNIATGNYTFEIAGVQPGSDYTISVTNNETISVNKATATVSVTNNTTNSDDGVDVYYTTDGSNPLESTTARLVRGRKVTVYALPGTAGSAGTIKVAIPGATASASCTYDITYSTSEGGYQNYLNNSASTDKTLGGEGHVVVYVQPYTSNETYTTTDRQTYVYAYEKKSDGTYASLTPAHRILSKTDETTVNNETWYYLDLEPASTYKEVNVLLGYYDTTTKTYKTSDATVANACQDMFLKFDVATGQITDATRAYTGDHFYTIGDNGTKKEAANPASDSPFFYAQVPLTWTSNGNSVKVLSGDTELSGATVKVQNGAETSDLSSVCKISVPTTLADKTELTLKPYKGTTASNVKFTITYQNGGYYFYESAKHYSTTAPLVFSADADGDKDQRNYGRKDINHVTTGDKTHYLANSWTYSTEPESKKTSIADNWNGAASATVNVIPANTTISQTVTGLTANTPYTVQMIVRGNSGAKGKLSLNDATKGTATDSKNFTGYDAAGTITTDGRVEALLSGTNNGWQKLEATANASAEGKLTISLAATGAEMELSDVTLLEKANIEGHVWTTVPTSNEKTDYDLSDRKTANAFSFFDRGDNKNAIVYANANTVLGMSENTYDVAVSNGSTYTMNKLVLTDQAQDGTTASGDVDKFYASGWSYGTSKAITTNSVYFDRSFKAGVKAAVCFPFSLSQTELETMFGSGAKAYNITAVDANNLTVTSEESTNGITANTPCLIEPGADYTASKEVTGSFTIDATPSDLSKSAGTGYTFEASYAYKRLWFNETEHCYSFDPTLEGRFKYVSKSKGADCKPFRAYIKESNTSGLAKVFKLVIGNTTTNIDDVKFEGTSQAPIYSISGALVSASGKKEGLPNGVYLQNGKKFIVNK